MPAIPLWPKHKSGIREGYTKEPIVRAVLTKWRALEACIILQGIKLNDLWRQKRPQKFLSKIDREVKLKTSVLENGLELFPALRHPAGCSLQYIIMLSESLGGAEWYESFINRFDEADVPCSISLEKLETLLGKFTRGNNYESIPERVCINTGRTEDSDFENDSGDYNPNGGD